MVPLTADRLFGEAKIALLWHCCEKKKTFWTLLECLKNSWCKKPWKCCQTCQAEIVYLMTFHFMCEIRHGDILLLYCDWCLSLPRV